MTYGWAGAVREFIAADPSATAHRLADQHRLLYRDRASDEQADAWRHELEVLSAALHLIDGADQWSLILEYELPLEGGRRPDVVLLAGDHVIVVEFKERTAINRADIDQVDAYARDLQDYHSACRGLPV